MTTPGLRLIQDLLAKSVAKWSVESVVKSTEEFKYESNKIKVENVKVEYVEVESSDELKHEIKQEYTEIKKGKRKRENEGVLTKKEKNMKRTKINVEYSETEHVGIETNGNVVHSAVDYPMFNENCDGLTDFKTDAKTEEESLIKRLLQKSVAKYSSQHANKIVERNIKSESQQDAKAEFKEDDKPKVTCTKSNFEKVRSVENYSMRQKKRTVENKEGEKCTTKTFNGRMRMYKEGLYKTSPYTPEEDELLLDAINTFGDSISYVKLTKKMDRTHDSIYARVMKLKHGFGHRKRKGFSLVEDFTIMDKVLSGFSDTDKKLRDLSLYYNDATTLNRPLVSLVYRWSNHIQPWLLQHCSGTLNLDISRMLANYLAETYESVNDIDWNAVAARPEFVGHTLKSLRFIFFSTLLKNTINKARIESTEITLKQVAVNANLNFTEKKGRTVNKKALIRQQQVIDYFEQHVKKHGITNYI